MSRPPLLVKPIMNASKRPRRHLSSKPPAPTPRKLPKSIPLKELEPKPKPKPKPEPPNPSGRLSLQGSKCTIKGETYILDHQIGRGGSSKVYQVHDGYGQRFALKRVTLSNATSDAVAGYIGEIDLLKRLHDEPRVVSLFQHDIENSFVTMVMEQGDFDLKSVILAHIMSPTNINMVRFYTESIFQCVRAIHEKEIVHSDLKPANFLLVRGFLKLIDFGIANVVPDFTNNVHRESQMGTLNYMAPETFVEHTLVKGSQFQAPYRVGKPSDIWSCGCIIHEMVYGHTPFREYGMRSMHCIQDPSTPLVIKEKTKHNVTVPKNLRALLEGCLRRNPSKRITFKEALSAEFLVPDF